MTATDPQRTEKFGGLASRFVVALVFVPVFIWLGLRNGIGIALLLNAAFFLGAWEMLKLAEARERGIDRLVMVVGTLALLNTGFYPESPGRLLYVLTALVLLAAVRRGLRPPVEGTADDLGGTVLGMLYLGLLGSFLPRLLQLGDGAPAAFFILFVVTWCTDTFAYFVGITFGRRPLLPKVSPKKSIEGLLGGIVGACIGLWVSQRTFASFLDSTDVVILGVGLAIAGHCGDLVESALKRDAGVKDTSKVLSGHGGILDRLDSLLFNAPLLYAYLLWQSSGG